MPIEFLCPVCNKRLRIKDESAGKQAKCPGCSQLLVIPEAGAYAASDSHISPNPGARPSQSLDFGDDEESSVSFRRKGGKHGIHHRPTAPVTAVGVVHFVLCGFNVLLGLCLIGSGILFGTFADSLRDAPELAMLLGFGMIGFILVGLMLLAVAVACFFAGRGIVQRQKYGRKICLILGGLTSLLILLSIIFMVSNGLSAGIIVLLVFDIAYVGFVFSILLNGRFAAEFL